MPCYLLHAWIATIANNVVISLIWGTRISWCVGVCECGVGDKAVLGEDHSQSTILIQQGQAIYVCEPKEEYISTTRQLQWVWMCNYTYKNMLLLYDIWYDYYRRYMTVELHICGKPLHRHVNAQPHVHNLLTCTVCMFVFCLHIIVHARTYLCSCIHVPCRMDT